MSEPVLQGSVPHETVPPTAVPPADTRPQCAPVEREARTGGAAAGRETVRVGGEAAEVARAETQAVLAMVRDESRRARLADVLAALEDGQLPAPEADALAELLELGLQSGRVRALYGPDGEQASLALYRRLPPGRELSESAANLTDALGALAGKTIDRISVSAVGPGEYGVTISTDEVELVLRLGRAGARLATIGA